MYLPPRFSVTEDQYEKLYKSLGSCFVAAVDYIANHTYWGSRLVTHIGRALFNTISKMGLDVISSGEPTYWPTDVRKIPDVIDFGVMKNISRDLISVETSLDLSSDQSPTIVTICNPLRSDLPHPYMKMTNRVNWLGFKKYLSSHCTENIALRTPNDIETNIANLNEIIKQAAEHATTYHPQSGFNKIYSRDIEHLVCEKKKS